MASRYSKKPSRKPAVNGKYLSSHSCLLHATFTHDEIILPVLASCDEWWRCRVYHHFHPTINTIMLETRTANPMSILNFVRPLGSGILDFNCKMDSKDKTSRNGSKTNLNESSLPLLDDSELMAEKGDSPKEKIELKEKSSTSSVDEEKDDSKAETKGKENQDEPITEEPKEGKQKSKKTHRRSPSCVQTMSIGLNLLDRDEKKVNEQVNIQFDDVIAEPDGSHSFDAIWRVAFVTFSGTKFWLYRLLAAIFALPCAVCWGITFALISFCHIWALSPFFRILDIFFYVIKRIWSGIIQTLCNPVFRSIGMVFSSVRIHHHKEQIP
uniref:Caveolin n=1 Tax=Strigamia maritima TaxID=126957 RepID=T1J6V1_STRMM